MSYAFKFDAASCTGCKACQIACKDRSNLPVGVLWRRVVEVSGGTWQRTGRAWSTDTFAYYLSLTCNHCIYPKCAGVCPTDAFRVRPDGIVLLDRTRCMGCGYCAWACPYAAPEYDPRTGVMTKCDLCCDELDAGRPPACVAACPLRVLELIEAGDPWVEEPFRALWKLPPDDHPYPLPRDSHTGPRLAVREHAAMHAAGEKAIANQEELAASAARGDHPLVAFSLLVQMSAGGFWSLLWLVSAVRASWRAPALLPLLWTLTACLAAGTAIAFGHLGRKRNAWRAVIHLRKSWLSRELLACLLLGASALLLVLVPGVWTAWLPAVAGFALVYSLGNVYALRTVPSWNNRRSRWSFFLSSLLLGQVLDLCFLAGEVPSGKVNLPGELWTASWAWTAVLLAAQLGLLIMTWKSEQKSAHAGRAVLIVLGLLAAGAAATASAPQRVPACLGVLLILLAEESVGRWLFYASREQILTRLARQTAGDPRFKPAAGTGA
jgi:anaerobic dimethyl sulfoxide reductase subunit B (iron-sulfur subunit)